MHYFLSIILRGDDGRYIYRLAKGTDIRYAQVICDISREGAKKWMNENKRRCVHAGRRANFFPEENESKPTVFFVNRAYEFS